MNKFREGDKVYCPMAGTRVYTIHAGDFTLYPLRIVTAGKIPDGTNCFYFTHDGTRRPSPATPVVFHATRENKKLLDKLYGVEFDAPPQEMVRIGNFEFPKPASAPPKDGEIYYVPALYNPDQPYMIFKWDGALSSGDEYLNSGLIHKEKEDAIQHAKVLIAISQGKTEL